VLIEGPTSAGKTSSIGYLARRTGHQFVRINNHGHTDIQEYVGSYVSDPNTSKLVFHDGVLVRALCQGHWLVLDELNLAPTEVLEALNRLLDDNRELLIPETQELITDFMLFATQNPSGLFAGAKHFPELSVIASSKSTPSSRTRTNTKQLTGCALSSHARPRSMISSAQTLVLALPSSSFLKWVSESSLVAKADHILVSGHNGGASASK
jgi:hypothetical protein